MLNNESRVGRSKIGALTLLNPPLSCPDGQQRGSFTQKAFFCYIV